MLWFILSLLTALAVSVHDVCAKKFFGHCTAYEMAAFPVFYSIPFFALSAFFIPIPELDPTFWWVFLVSLPINAVAFILYMLAIKLSPLSITIPFLAFTPVFIIATGYLFLGEPVSFEGIFGIFAVVVGSYLLNMEGGKRDLLYPIKEFLKEKGSVIMLGVSFLYSLAAVLGKMAIQHSSPEFFGVYFFLVYDLLMIWALFSAKKISMGPLLEEGSKAVFLGILLFAHILFHSFAVSLTKVAYMISIKRLSLLFSVALGVVFLGEKQTRQRFTGAFTMFLGAIIIALAGK